MVGRCVNAGLFHRGCHSDSMLTPRPTLSPGSGELAEATTRPCLATFPRLVIRLRAFDSPLPRKHRERQIRVSFGDRLNIVANSRPASKEGRVSVTLAALAPKDPTALWFSRLF